MMVVPMMAFIVARHEQERLAEHTFSIMSRAPMVEQCLTKLTTTTNASQRRLYSVCSWPSNIHQYLTTLRETFWEFMLLYHSAFRKNKSLSQFLIFYSKKKEQLAYSVSAVWAQSEGRLNAASCFKRSLTGWVQFWAQFEGNCTQTAFKLRLTRNLL